MGEPLQMVRCDRQQMTLTAAGCARLYRSAAESEPQPWEGRSHCRGCVVGAVRAGIAAPVAIATAALDHLKKICPRCQRPTARLINGKHCVSCYNRQREAEKGRNAKGGRPRLCARLYTATLAVTAGPVTHLEAVAAVTSLAEAVARVARGAGAPVTLGVPPLALPLPVRFQLELRL